MKQPPSTLDSVLSLAAWINLIGVLAVAGLIMFVGENWWFSTALSYLPRLPWLIPSLLLTGLLILRRPKLTPLAIIPALIVAVPLMGLCMPVATAEPADHAMRVISCNIQNGQPRFGSVVREMERLDADIMLFQECETPRERMSEKWPDFYHAHIDMFDVTSRWPVTMLDVVGSEASNRYCAAIFRIDHPERPFVLVNVHMSTVRHGLGHLRNTSLSIGESTQRVSDWQAIREIEFQELADAVAKITDEPIVMAGDFNQPWQGQFLQRQFSNWTSAFDVAGTGYGYTTPTDTEKMWPKNTPWIRIDHIAVNDGFGVTHAEVGKSAGSDHRLIAADLTW